MDADEWCRNLSEKDILCELHSKRYPVLKDGELEAGYGACKKYTETAKDELVLRLQFDCATRLGYKDEAAEIALLASTHYAVTAEMYFAIGAYFFGKRVLQRARDYFSRAIAVAQESDHQNRDTNMDASLSLLENTSTQHKKKKKKKKKTKKAFGSTHQQDPASLPSHPKESEKEQQRTMASSASSLADQCMFIGGSDGTVSLPSRNPQKQAASAQFTIVYQPVPMPKGVADDTEGEKSLFLCFSNSTEGRSYGCDWYRLDLIKKECNKIFGRLEWGGISIPYFGVATVGSTIYILRSPNRYTYGGPEHDELDYNDVFYLDVHHPQDGWKVAPQLPSAHLDSVGTSMNETVYMFNGEYASSLDTSDSGSGWKPLAMSPILKWRLDLAFQMALPDPTRDRILLFSYDSSFFAYYPRKGELECIDSELNMNPAQICKACTIVDGVFYHTKEDSKHLLFAYDLDQGKMLIPIYEVDIAPYNYFLFSEWDHLLDLSGGKLCLVKHHGGGREKNLIVFLKLKVQKEAGGDKVRITALSFDTFRIVEDIRFEHAVAL